MPNCLEMLQKYIFSNLLMFILDYRDELLINDTDVKPYVDSWNIYGGLITSSKYRGYHRKLLALI